MTNFFVALALQLISCQLTGESEYYIIVMNGWLLLAFGYPIYECVVKPAFDKAIFELKMKKRYNQLDANDQDAIAKWQDEYNRGWIIMMDGFKESRVKCFKKLLDVYLELALAHIGSCMMIELFLTGKSHEEIYKYGTMLFFGYLFFNEVKSFIK